MNYEKVLSNVIELVKEVGDYQLEAKKNRDYKVDTKGDNIDYVTDIDHKSEEMIVKRIHELYPDHSILAEETGMTDRVSDYKWVIDPIDGTTNFVHNYPMHAISIGLKYKGETVLGVVELPAVKMRFTAIRGQGAYLNGELLHVSDAQCLGSCIIATGFPYFRKENNLNLPYFNSIVNDVAGIRRSGSAATDLCFVAAGMVDGYWEFAINEWDVCAGLLFIEEAGGVATVTQQEGHMLVVCGNEKVHSQLKSIIIK